MHGRETAKENRAEAEKWQMIKAIIGIGVALVWITFFALVKAAGMTDRRLGEIRRLMDCYQQERDKAIIREWSRLPWTSQ